MLSDFDFFCVRRIKVCRFSEIYIGMFYDVREVLFDAEIRSDLFTSSIKEFYMKNDTSNYFHSIL